jgi:hypothetical protein
MVSLNLSSQILPLATGIEAISSIFFVNSIAGHISYTAGLAGSLKTHLIHAPIELMNWFLIGSRDIS